MLLGASYARFEASNFDHIFLSASFEGAMVN